MRRAVIRTLAGCLVAVCVVIGSGVGALYVSARRAVPQAAGKLMAPDLKAPVTITRDSNGIPHISAQSAADAYYGLGVVHAQDRLWQMELARRVASGTLAELIGERGLESDRLFRTLGLDALVAHDEGTLDPETHTVLTAYASGVNAFLSSEPSYPIELTLLRANTLAPWRVRDTLLVGKLLAFRLAGNWDNELWRLRLAARLNPRQLSEFTRSDDARALVPYATLRRVYSELGLPGGISMLGALEVLGRLAPTGRGRAVGSNNWAVDGRRSQSGKPLLANDPHLELTAPSAWYFAHLDAPDLRVIGASVPGLAGVVLGRNESVAWSFTNMAPDTQDLYFERLTGDGGYLTPHGSQPFVERIERIQVRGAEDVNVTVRCTRHGPVVSDLVEGTLVPTGYALALAWTGLEPGDTTLEFPLRVGRAKAGADVRVAAQALTAPAQNIVYADVHGTIGFVAAGKVPRRKENPLRGSVPAPGWLSDYDWDGMLSPDELPSSVQPDQGYLVTANQNTAPADYRQFLGVDFGPNDRAARIRALLERTPAHDTQSFARIQLDQHSSLADALVPLLLETLGPPPDDLVEEAATLAAWGRDLGVDSRAGAVFGVWLRELARALYEDELGEMFGDDWEPRTEFVRAVLGNSEGASRWCDDNRTQPVETCRDITRSALKRACAYLGSQLGGNRATWTWGRLHPSIARHAVFGYVPLVGDLFNAVALRGGDASSPNVGSYIWSDDAPFENAWGPGFRAVYDLADLDQSVGILNTGQSGHVLSQHYRDMLRPWQDGRYVSLAMRGFEHGAGGSWLLTPSENEAVP